MNPTPPPDPLPLIPDGLSDEEFLNWVKADPKNLAAIEALAAHVVRSEPGLASPELRTQAEVMLAKQRERLALANVHAKMQALTALMDRPGGTMYASDRLAQLNQLMDEVTDALLETPEPHRTKILKDMLPIREQVRKLKLKD